MILFYRCRPHLGWPLREDTYHSQAATTKTHCVVVEEEATQKKPNTFTHRWWVLRTGNTEKVWAVAATWAVEYVEIKKCTR